VQLFFIHSIFAAYTVPAVFSLRFIPPPPYQIANTMSAPILRFGFARYPRNGLLLFILLLMMASVADALTPAREQQLVTAFDAAFEQVYRRYQLPGLAVGVIADGHLIYRRTAGELRADSGEEIDADTVFKIASNSKSMTTAVLARLVDQGKLAWTDPVIQYLPDFRMADPWITGQIQVRDLLIHAAGLPSGAGDAMLWPENSRFSRRDIVASIAQLEPTHSFRSHYAYNNLLYVVAGEVAAAAAGKPLDQLLREEVFVPLGLNRCQAGRWQRDEVGNVAQPHHRQRNRNIVVRADGTHIPDSAGLAAGGIRCSLNDMLTWIHRAWLVPDPETPWLSATQRRALWSLANPMPITARMRQWDNTHLYGYGYGWRLSDVDGHWKVAHTGTLMGMYSAVVLLPDLRSGFIILINGAGGQARTVLSQALLKRFTRPDAPHLNAAYYSAQLEYDTMIKTIAGTAFSTLDQLGGSEEEIEDDENLF